jgi:hypothetical protein
MAHGRHDPERRAAERGTQLGDQFFEGIFLRTVGSALVAVETRAMPGRMPEFMQRRAVPVDRLEIGLRRRDLNIVVGCCIECAISTNPKCNSAGLDQGFDRGFDEARRRRRSSGDLVGQFLTLIGVETIPSC